MRVSITIIVKNADFQRCQRPRLFVHCIKRNKSQQTSECSQAGTKCTQQTCRRPGDVKWRLWTVATVFALRPRASTAASRIFPATTHLVAPFSRTKRKHKTATYGHCELSKKLRYRSRTARPNVSGKILPLLRNSLETNCTKKSGTNRSNGVRGLQSSNV